MSNKETTKQPPIMNGRGPMVRGPGGHAPAEKAKDIKGTTKKLAGLLAKYKIAVIIVIIFAIGSTLFSIVGPKILGDRKSVV